MINFTKWNLIPAVCALLFAFTVITPPVSATEETVSLTFKKIASPKGKGNLYTVKKGDWLSEIIRGELGVSQKEIYRILVEIKNLNPQINDMDMIYEGQKILLPWEKKSIKNETLDHKAQDAETTKNDFQKYTVKKGDQLSEIVRNKLGVSYREIYTTLKQIKKLNPHISNINIIRPGDILTLPIRRRGIPIVKELTGKIKPIISVKESAPKEKILLTHPPKPFLSIQQELTAIETVVGRMDGSVIKEGNFYIPIPPSGQMSINCATVPVVEFDEGTTTLLDFSNRVPESLKYMIESTWKNYVFIRRKQDSVSPSMLEGVINSSPSYTLKRAGRYTSIGNNPEINIFVDWIVSHNGADSFAIRLLKDRSLLLNKNVKDYAKKKDLEIIEILQERGIVETEKTSPPKIAPIITNYETKLQLAESILSTMGYVFMKDYDINVFDIGKDVFNLSIKTDLYLTIDGREILILFKKIPKQFLDTLEGRGISVTTLSEDMKKTTIVEGTLGAIGIPFLRDNFSFPLVNERGEIRLPAIRAKSREGFLYLIDYDMDSEIYGLLNEKWKVNVVKY